VSGEFLFVLGGPVGKSIINPVPYVLRRIEFGGIGRKVFRMDAGVTMEKLLHQLTAMNRSPIPQQDYGASQMAEQRLEEPDHLFSSQSPTMELSIKRQVLPLGRDDHRVKGVDAALFVPHGTVRSLSLGRPGAFEVGDEQKATFIQENQVRAQLCGLFLYAATDSGANGQSRPRRVDRRGARASDNSSPCHARDAKARWDGSAPEPLSRLLWQCASRSTTRFGTRPLVRHAVRLGRGESSARRKGRRGAPERGGRASPTFPRLDRFAPTATPIPGWHPPSGRWWFDFCPAATNGRLGAAAVLIALLLLEVS